MGHLQFPFLIAPRQLSRVLHCVLSVSAVIVRHPCVSGLLTSQKSIWLSRLEELSLFYLGIGVETNKGPSGFH